MPLTAPTFFRSLAAFILTALFLPTFCFGTLTWTTQRIELTTKPSEKVATGNFHFVNSGSETVTITSVQASCGCTTATLEKHRYAPGEAGEIKTVFTLGDRVGEQEKSISVVTDESPTARTTLLLHVTIPELLLYAPRLLIWNIGDALGEKTTVISTNSNRQIATITLTLPLPKEVTALLEPVEAGMKYKLIVRPVSTTQVMNVSLECVVTFADATSQHCKIYLLVR